MGYWAVEVERGQYIFLPQHGRAPGEDDHDVDFFDKPISCNDGSQTMSDVVPPAFYHNPIHDVKSLWWICVEKVLTKQVLVNGEPLVDETRFKNQWYAASNIFPSANEARLRERFLRTKAIFSKCTATLNPRMTGVVDALNNIREELVSMYEATEAKAPRITSDGYADKTLFRLVRLFTNLETAARGMEITDLK